MPLLNQLERKLGWIAIPRVVRVLMCFQLLVFVLIAIQLAENDGSGSPLFELLELNFGKLISGEVWRLFSFAFLPPTFSPLMMLIAFMFTVFLGDLLEDLWGSFRTTLYVLGSIVGTVAAAALLYFNGYPEFIAVPFSFSASLLFAVSVYYPHLEIRLFFVIPVKLYWLGIFSGALMLLAIFQALLTQPVVSLAILLTISNFLIVFWPGFQRAVKTRGEVAVRRRRFEAAKASATMALHECAGCGKTENDDPNLVFRVADDGEEYCDVCRSNAA